MPASTRIPTAFANTLWDRRLESGAQRELDLSPRGSAAASQADGNSGGEHLPREQVVLLTTILGDLGAVGGKASRFVGDIANVSAYDLLLIAGRLMRSLWQVVEFPSSLRNDS